MLQPPRNVSFFEIIDWVLRLLFLLASLVVIIYCIAFRTFFAPALGHILAASVVGGLIAYVVASWSLRYTFHGFSRIFLSAATAASGMWGFEFLFQTFLSPDTACTLRPELTHVGIVDSPISLLWTVIIVAFPLVFHKYMDFTNKLFLVVAAGGLVTFALWVAAGIHPAYLSGSLPCPVSSVPYTALSNNILNTISKFLIVITPAMAFWGSGSKSRVTIQKS